MLCISLAFQSPLKPSTRRAELDAVLGPDPLQTTSVIIQNPHVLNQLPYALAVIKETLRLFPTSSSIRAGEPGFSVTGSEGRVFPTEGCLVWSIHQAIGRDITNWPDPDSFIPERFLVLADDPLHPIKGHGDLSNGDLVTALVKRWYT